MRQAATLRAPTHGGHLSGRTGRPSFAGHCRRSLRPAFGFAPASGCARRPRYGSRLLVIGCSRLFPLNAVRRIRRATLRFLSSREGTRGLPRGHARAAGPQESTPFVGSSARLLCARSPVMAEHPHVQESGA